MLMLDELFPRVSLGFFPVLKSGPSEMMSHRASLMAGTRFASSNGWSLMRSGRGAIRLFS